jgi:hypothetical protein
VSSAKELLALIERARHAVEDSKEHWKAVPGLTGDQRFKRQHEETLELLDAMRSSVERRDPRNWPA